MSSNTFLSLYAQQSDYVASKQSINIANQCQLPAVGKVSKTSKPTMQTRYEIENYLEKAGTQIGDEQRRTFKLCLLWSYFAEGHQSKADNLLQDLMLERKKAVWSPDEEYIVAYWLLDRYKWNFKKPADFEQIHELLVSAFKRFTEENAKKAFGELTSALPEQNKLVPVWCKLMLKELADLHKKSFWISYFYGALLSNGNERQEQQWALDYLKRAEINLVEIKPEDQARLLAWIKWNRSLSFIGLSYYEEQQNRDDLLSNALQILVSLKTSVPNKQNWTSLSDMYYEITIINLLFNNNDGAIKELREGLDRFSENDELIYLNSFVSLAQGKLDEANKLCQDRLDKYSKKDRQYQHWLLSTIFMKFLMQQKDFEFTARQYLSNNLKDHDYVRMMLYWWLKKHEKNDEANNLLKERWQRINADAWPSRLEQGDKDVRAEMLIGYFAGKVSYEEVFGPLSAINRFSTSRFANLGQSLFEMRSDYFYDALFQNVSGNPATRKKRMLESLKRVIDTRQVTYFEYHMARYLSQQVRDDQLGGR